MIAASEDLANLVSLGEPVVFNGQTFYGIFSLQSELVINGEVIWAGKSLVGNFASLGGLRFGNVVNIKNDFYKVQQEPFLSPDGAMVRVPLVGPVLNPIQATIVPWLTTMGDPITTVMGDPIDLIKVG
jgi:hypothetical protein